MLHFHKMLNLIWKLQFPEILNRQFHNSCLAEFITGTEHLEPASVAMCRILLFFLH